MRLVRVGVVGYGNLGRGVELAVSKTRDLEMVGVFSRRNPSDVATLSAPVYSLDDILNFKDEIDVLILCGGSHKDLPEQTPELVKNFNVVDSFDNHAKIPEHFEKVDLAAKVSGKIGIISVGWDPGLFSLNRALGEAILPEGETYTFWGMGLSQGHSDALRRVAGVAGAVQYTVPSEEAIARVRSAEQPNLETSEKHKRVCYVVLNGEVDAATVEHEIKTMPDYFAPYETEVNFISAEELREEHSKMPHGGFVMRSGKTDETNIQNIEYSLKLGSNPEFTASVLVAYARALGKMSVAGQTGAKTVYDVAPGLLSAKSPAELRKNLL